MANRCPRDSQIDFSYQILQYCCRGIDRNILSRKGLRQKLSASRPSCEALDFRRKQKAGLAKAEGEPCRLRKYMPSSGAFE